MVSHYEIRFRGSAPIGVMVGLRACDQVWQQGETVLITESINQRALQTLLLQLSDLGLEIREFRRLPEIQPALSGVAGG